MSVIQRPSDAPPTELTVAAVLRAVDGRHLAAALEALAAQGYELAATYVVGGPDEARRLAEERDAAWLPTQSDVIAAIGDEVSHVWFLHEDALPQPDALAALAAELARVDASVAGSKVIKPGSQRQLESVGSATDVLAHPYLGLEVDEVDQGQHDIVRDVSFVSGVSLLARRDLLKGLGGPDPIMAPEAAAIDLCWRARASGGRVVIVPSSEVIHAGEIRDGVPRWREQAGRVRVMLKNYSLLTLAWVVIAAFFVELGTSVVRTFFDRRLGLVDLARAWIWNLVHFPSVISARSKLRRARAVGDEEQFRYQVRGSVELQETGGLITNRLRRSAEDRQVLPADPAQAGQLAGPPYIGALVVGSLFLIASTWSILVNGVPVVGFTLPVSDSAGVTFDSWAGGWNPAGLGSAQPLHPAVAATALLNALLLSSSLATTAITVAAVGAALFGTTRVLWRLGAAPFSRYAAGAAVAAGPAAVGLTSAGYWPGLLAVAAAPWALAALLSPWPSSWRKRLGWGATATLLIGLMAAFAPLAAPIPFLALVGWALFGPGRWRSVAHAILPTILALFLLHPWLTTVSTAQLLGDGVFEFWEPSVMLMAALAGAVLITILIGDVWAAGLAAAGGVLVATGTVLARATQAGAGRELAVAGLVAAALGSGLAVGAALESPRRLETARLWRKLLAWTAAVGGLLLIGSALLVVPDGRIGLPEDQLGDRLAFTVNRADPHGPDRILLVGPTGTLPGEYRNGPGFTYRVVSAPVPPLDEAWLHDPLPGDEALAGTLERLMTEDEVRPGEALAPFGIRWVVLTGRTPFDAAMASQLDLRPLSLPGYRVFENELPSPRAVSGEEAWERVGTGYEGSVTGRRVYVAENADARWEPDRSASGWANEVSAALGSARFGGATELRNIALATAAYAVALVVVALFGRAWRRE
ncbi:MAG: glycosyltransferase family 2 protein [Acidimicrobiia bacterium]